MQSGTSCFNKTIFKKNITHFWPIWGIYLVFLLYALPLTLLLSTENPGTGAKAAKQIAEDNLARYTACLGGALTPMFVFIAATVCAMTVFFYLYQNRSANMIHALPVSRKELYVTNVVSGFLFLIVPQILTFVITAFGSLSGFSLPHDNIPLTAPENFCSHGSGFLFAVISCKVAFHCRIK
mgnify:CR=1 FL=1